MATVLAPCAEGDCLDPIATLLPADPFTSVRYHFGMLLGVDDFDAEKAYHLGKMRLHNAWLHGEGVVWGLDVRVDAPACELEVLPGLALDAAGRELALGKKACLSLSEWLTVHQGDPDLAQTKAHGSVSFDGHVVMRFRACLARQVPAFADTCNGADTSTAYSRIDETVELFLRPGLAPVATPTHHLLRLLFRLDQPELDANGAPTVDDQDVIDARAAIDALAPAARPAAYRASFARFAAADGIHRAPAQDPDDESTALFPALDDTEIVLADLHDLTLREVATGWEYVSGRVDVSVRPSHVPVRTVQELTCGPASSGAEQGTAPRIDPRAVTLAGTTVTIPVSAALSAASVQPGAFSVTTFEDVGGWTILQVQSAAYDDPTTTIQLTLGAAPAAGSLVRLIARGTGEQPLLGTDLVPLAGVVGGLPGTPDDGHDFVLMQRS
jgi:hypothetical protein